MRRARIQLDVPDAISRVNRHMYRGFPDLRMCWEQTPIHRNYFTRILNCEELSKYHGERGACRRFDDISELIAGREYRQTFWAYYTVHGRLPGTTSYTGELCPSTMFASLSMKQIVKRPDLTSFPPTFNSWPDTFTIEASGFFANDQDRRDAIDSIEACIRRRVLFRNACVRACNRRIDTDSHDMFLLILQILRARLIYFTAPI